MWAELAWAELVWGRVIAHPSRGGNQTTYWCDITGTCSSKPVNKESNTPTHYYYNPFDWSMKQPDEIFHWSKVSEGDPNESYGVFRRLFSKIFVCFYKYREYFSMLNAIYAVNDASPNFSAVPAFKMNMYSVLPIKRTTFLQEQKHQCFLPTNKNLYACFLSIRPFLSVRAPW